MQKHFLFFLYTNLILPKLNADKTNNLDNTIKNGGVPPVNSSTNNYGKTFKIANEPFEYYESMLKQFTFDETEIMWEKEYEHKWA